MMNENDDIDKIRKKKPNLTNDEQLQNEVKKWEVESTKGGKLNKTTKTKNIN
jgi:hypothetical protein